MCASFAAKEGSYIPRRVRVGGGEGLMSATLELGRVGGRVQRSGHAHARSYSIFYFDCLLFAYCMKLFVPITPSDHF